MRCTAKTLDAMCDNLNRSLGLPTLDAPWRERVDAGAYLVEKSYGGYMLSRYAGDGGGIRTMHFRRASGQECAQIIEAFHAAVREHASTR